MTDRRLQGPADTRGYGSTRHPSTVLIVESHDDTRELYADGLRNVGFDVDAAATTNDALVKANTADALVTDLIVRGTVDGLTLVSRVRQANANMPILVVTGYVCGMSPERAIEAGADMILVKPVLPEDLARELHRVLASAGRRERHGQAHDPSPLSGLLQKLATEAQRCARLGGGPVTVLRQLVDGLGVSALAADDAGRYIVTNADASELTGYSADELHRLSVWQLTPHANEHEAETLWRAFVQLGRQSGHYQLLTKSGRIVTVEYAARAHVLPNLHVSLLRRR